MDITKKDYEKMAKRHASGSKMSRTIPMAFLIGGAICCFGQFLTEIYLMFMELEQAQSFTSITLVGLSALATGLGLYGKLAKTAGAGTLVPITGFANAVVSPALEFKSEGMILGTAAKMFVIAGPVIVYGITASFLYGILYYIVKLCGGAI